MYQSNTYRPIARSNLRLRVGKMYFRMKRYAKWWKMRHQFANTIQPSMLPHVMSHHRTPLYRELHQVDRSIQEGKVTNIQIAIRTLHGLVLEPGKTMSYWRRIGNPSRRKGYVDGMILYCGQMKLGIGGGLCQLSNLIYWITLHTPLQVVERYRHSYDVFPDANRTQPFGSGATCAYNYLDLMIANPTNTAYQLSLTLDETHLNGEWRSITPPLYRYEIFEQNHTFTSEPWGYMRHNQLFRNVYSIADGTHVREEWITDNHALMMYSPLLHAPTGASTANANRTTEQTEKTGFTI